MARYCPATNGPVLYLNCKECEDQECQKFHCLVVGSRTFADYELLKTKLDYFLQNHRTDTVIVSGGANGADSLAKRYAEEREYDYQEFPADWNKYGKKAGYLRNKEMHEHIAKFNKRAVIAFWDGKSKGTAHNFDLAKQYNNQLVVIRFSDAAANQ